jgi:penicillin-binding protein 1A
VPAAGTVGRSKVGCFVRIFAALLVLSALALGAGALGWLWIDASLPDVFSFQAYRQIARESSRVHAAGGEVIAQFGEEIRTVVPQERIPDTMRYALVCAEDAAFFSHPGLDFVGIARAIWVDLTTGKMKQGASTITQQFAKTRFLSSEKSVLRKLRELVLARKLEERLEKNEILTLYANEIYFGHGRYGAEEAARFYFGRSVSEIDVAQAALLAGIINSPARFSPLRHPDNARTRRSYVLKQMQENGYITAADLERAEAEPLPTASHDPIQRVGPWFVEAVRREVLQKVDQEALLYGGLRIEVALDTELQRAAELAVRTGLTNLDKQYESAKPLKSYANEIELADGLTRLRSQQPTPAAGRVLLGVVVGADEKRKAWQLDLGTAQGWLPYKAAERYRVPEPARVPGPQPALTPPPADAGELPKWTRGDLLRISIREKHDGEILLSPEMGPQVALVAMEPETRLVRALVGGDDFTLHPFDRALLARRQPGSTFKTFVYGAALEAQMVTPETEFRDEQRTYTGTGRAWTPRNYSGHFDGQAHSLRNALAQSINSIAVAVAAQVGPQRVASFAKRMGVNSPLTVGLPLALGASSVSLLELTNAYATLAAEGRVAAPILVTRIVDRTGRDVFLAARELGTRVVEPEVTRALTDMLGEVVRTGSGRGASKVGRPVAGKTGTSNGSRDAWFVGFSAELCAGIWVGHDDRKPLPKGSGGTLAVPIWTDFMRDGLERVPVHPLPRLPHVLAGPVAGLPPAVDPEMGAEAVRDEALEPADDPVLPPDALPPVQRPVEDRDDE